MGDDEATNWDLRRSSDRSASNKIDCYGCTTDYANYKFKYYENKTVDAINNGSVEKTGQWDGNASNNTTWANFTGAVYPLLLINGTWHIDRNSWTYVEASQTVGSDTKIMRLDKQ